MKALREMFMEKIQLFLISSSSMAIILYLTYKRGASIGSLIYDIEPVARIVQIRLSVKFWF